MRSAIVPAQITTVEDRVAGNLSLTQLVLLLMSPLLGALIFASLTPALNLAPYKVVLTLLLTAFFGVAAIRVQGKLVIFWAVVLLRYAVRPRYHVFNKNSAYLRKVAEEVSEEQEIVAETTKPDPILSPRLSIAEVVRLQGVIANPKAKLQFITNKKGALNVRITEVKQENLVPQTD